MKLKSGIAMKKGNFISLILLALCILHVESNAQTRVTARGSDTYRRTGIHNGNKVHTVFTNYGVIAQPVNDQYPRGAWKNDNNGYIGDVSPVVGVLNPIRDYPALVDTNHDGVKDPIYDGILDTIHTVIVCPVDRGDAGKKYSPGGKSWTFEPIPGFMNPAINQTGKGVAMSDQMDTWPSSWPDQPSFIFDETPEVINGDTIVPTVNWNGYFGSGLKATTTAQESYFWMDDNNDEEMFDKHGFRPDSMDLTRRGHAIQVSVRGLQWGGDPVAQNVLFWLYNIKNDGTTTYDQAVFGVLVGTYVGIRGDEWNDDASFFDVRESITYTWDFDHYVRPSANPQWSPDPTAVGYVAYAFLESPGNGIDGIDNDHDNVNYTPSAAPFFNESDFDTTKTTWSKGDSYVLIDKATFTRTVKTVGTTIDTVISMGTKFVVGPNQPRFVEGNYDVKTNLVNPNSFDGIDNDLDGLIDECYTTHYRQYKFSPPTATNPKGTVLIDTLNATQHFDYATGLGSSDPMIDEKRDDGIDNDRDWIEQFDDIGSKGDGDPKYGAKNHVPDPGEPNFDATDIHESDQLGLTSFQYFVPSSDIKLKENEDLWKRLHPGYYDVPKTIVKNIATKGEDGDFLYGSGYFPLAAGKTERFSLALAYGDDLEDVITTKQIVQQIYNKNYKFPKSPDEPTLTAVGEDGKVTLYWDHVSEESIDPETREKDFEGYRIYKSTNWDFSDQYSVTNAQGKVIEYKPFKQFDLKDNITGYFPLSNFLRHLYGGYSPYLGNDSGIQNSFVDTDVKNGVTYYYVLTAYDRGDAANDIFPKESQFDGSITKNALGQISWNKNAKAVTPAKPSAGLTPIPTDKSLTRKAGYSTTGVKYEVVDPYKLINTSYLVTFKDTLLPEVHGTDTLWLGPVAKTYSVMDSITQKYKVFNSSLIRTNDNLVFDGVRLSFDTTYQSIDSIKTAETSWRVHHTLDTTQSLLNVTCTSSFQVGGSTRYNYRLAKDYAFIFNDTKTDSSNDLYPLFPAKNIKAKNINFHIEDITDIEHPRKIPFVFVNTLNDSTISNTEKIYLADSVLTPSGKQLKLSWILSFLKSDTASYKVVYKPAGNDTLILRFIKPMNAEDEFSMKITKPSVDPKLISSQLKNIKVVPNPYVVTNLYEPAPSSGLKGRGERVIRFNGLPPKCQIHIFTSSGDLVRTLENDGSPLDGSLKWDLRSKEGLEVAFGVYFYVVEVDGISDKKTGKIAIIK